MTPTAAATAVNPIKRTKSVISLLIEITLHVGFPPAEIAVM